ncbi:hypothetical protein LQW54_008115 [Pestalotiopsis sp. IQ-011]
MYTQWDVQYGDKKTRWNYNGIGDHYMCKPTERITGGFRILATGKHPEQRFAKFVGDVLIHANGHYEHMKAMERVIEHCAGKPEGPLRSFNAMLLDLSPEQETALRAGHRESDATSLGHLAVGDVYFDCKVFHSWDPEKTQGYRDDDGNVMVTSTIMTRTASANSSSPDLSTKQPSLARFKSKTDDKEEILEETRGNEGGIFAMLKPESRLSSQGREHDKVDGCWTDSAWSLVDSRNR